MIYALADHKIWIAVLLCVVAGWIWLTYEYKHAPKVEDKDETDITIDDLIN